MLPGNAGGICPHPRRGVNRHALAKLLSRQNARLFYPTSRMNMIVIDQIEESLRRNPYKNILCRDTNNVRSKRENVYCENTMIVQDWAMQRTAFADVRGSLATGERRSGSIRSGLRCGGFRAVCKQTSETAARHGCQSSRRKRAIPSSGDQSASCHSQESRGLTGRFYHGRLRWNAGTAPRREAVGHDMNHVLGAVFPAFTSDIGQAFNAHDPWRGGILTHRRDGTPMLTIGQWYRQRSDMPVAELAVGIRIDPIGALDNDHGQLAGHVIVIISAMLVESISAANTYAAADAFYPRGLHRCRGIRDRPNTAANPFASKCHMGLTA